MQVDELTVTFRIDGTRSSGLCEWYSRLDPSARQRVDGWVATELDSMITRTVPAWAVNAMLRKTADDLSRGITPGGRDSRGAS